MKKLYNFLKVKLCYRTYWKQWLAFLTICFLVFACSGGDGDSDTPCPNQPQLTTFEVSNISTDQITALASATFSAEIQNIQLGANCETFSITNQGFVYSTNIQPTTSDNVVNANGENASVNVANLMPETTYYVRTYLTNTLGTFYGNEVSFTTPEYPTNPVYLAENGVTIKATDWAEVGMSGEIDGITYTIVDRPMLEIMIANEEDVTVVCTTLISDMHFLFFNNDPNFNQPIGSWDVSNVTDMSYMFVYSPFNQPIGDWDVSSVTNMRNMFDDSSFNQPIIDWDVSSVMNMRSMFQGSSFNQPIGDWDVSNVEVMHLMFSSSSFNQPIGSWDVSNVTDMSYMFSDSSFNQPIGDWDVSNVTNMRDMFSYTPLFNQDISSWDVSNVADMTYMFNLANSFNQNLSSWDISNVTNCVNFCDGADSWTLPKPNFTNCGDIGCN